MKRNLLLFSLISLWLVGLVGGIFIRGTKTYSTVENKELQKFPGFTLQGFMDTTFQTQLETALSDQILFGSTFKYSYNQLKGNNMDIVVSGLKGLYRDSKPVITAEDSDNTDSKENVPSVAQGSTSTDNISTDNGEQTLINSSSTEPETEIDLSEVIHFSVELTPKVNGLIEVNDTGHLIYPNKTVYEVKPSFIEKSNNYNSLCERYPDIDFYCYYIETDVDINFIEGEINHDLAESFKEMLNPKIQFGLLAIRSPEMYYKYFYKTDHHWAVPGQIEGYKSIIRLLLGKEEPFLKTEEIYLPDVEYYGSKSRTIDDFTVYDQFSVLWAELSEHEIYINGAPGSYDNKQEYINGNYSNGGPGYNHYAVCNGGDYGLVEYRFNQPEKENILIFVESFSNPINALIASHFNNTYIVDLRAYQTDMGAEFDFGDFVERYDIDKVLFLGHYTLFLSHKFIVND